MQDIDFLETNTKYKIIGVGNAGCNAVNHMYQEGIDGASFLVCNTEKAAFDSSLVPNRLLLGEDGNSLGNDTSKGLGISVVKPDNLSQMLDADTKLVFIIANLGDGTAKNVAPVIAQKCKENNILTIGIVSIPIGLEGSNNIQQVNQEIGKMKESVDSIIVLDNQQLFNIFPNINHSVGLKKAKDLIKCIVGSILGFIKTQGTINLEINDLRTILKNGGDTYWGIGYGKERVGIKQAFLEATHNPLMPSFDIYKSHRILVYINSGANESRPQLLLDYYSKALSNFMDGFTGDFELKWGFSINPDLGDKVKVTILASDFDKNL